MQLYPMAPFMVQQLRTDTTLSDNGNSDAITLLVFAFACVWIHNLHRRQGLWSRSDAFLPERWIDPHAPQQDAGCACVLPLLYVGAEPLPGPAVYGNGALGSAGKDP